MSPPIYRFISKTMFYISILKQQRDKSTEFSEVPEISMSWSTTIKAKKTRACALASLYRFMHILILFYFLNTLKNGGKGVI